MDNNDYTEISSVSYLNSTDGIQFDGQSYALFGMMKLNYIHFLILFNILY